MFGLNLLAIKTIIAGLVFASLVATIWGAIHYYNLHQQAIGDAERELKYQKLREKGNEIVNRALVMGVKYQQELVKQNQEIVKQLQLKNLAAESLRTQDAKQFITSDPIAKLWADDFVPNHMLELIRMHKLAAEANISNSASSIVSSGVSQ